jgi:hypothetical protein
MSHDEPAQGNDVDTSVGFDTEVSRPTFTIRQACEVCRVSRRTITRRLDELAKYGAFKDSDGHWLIPVEALEAVGLRPGRPSAPDALTQDSGIGQSQTIDTEAQTVTIPLDEYKALLKAESERDGLAREIERADATSEALRESAWQWYEQAQLIHRVLMPSTGPVVDVREGDRTKRRGLFRR